MGSPGTMSQGRVFEEMVLEEKTTDNIKLCLAKQLIAMIVGYRLKLELLKLININLIIYLTTCTCIYLILIF